MDLLDGLTLLVAVLAGDHVSWAVLGHVLTLTVATLHRLRAVANLVLALAAGAHERVGTLIDVVTLLATVATPHRTSIRTLSGKMTLLLADAAFTRETISGVEVTATSFPSRHDE